jgi:hypothetical protein
MMATAYFAAKRRANGCPDSRSDSHNSGGRLGLGWCHLFRPTGMITCAIALPKARSRAKSASRTDQRSGRTLSEPEAGRKKTAPSAPAASSVTAFASPPDRKILDQQRSFWDRGHLARSGGAIQRSVWQIPGRSCVRQPPVTIPDLQRTQTHAEIP